MDEKKFNSCAKVDVTTFTEALFAKLTRTDFNRRMDSALGQLKIYHEWPRC